MTTPLSRRHFLAAATAIGASGLWASAQAKPSTLAWTERRELFPEGVASGDPEPTSVILWTRYPRPAGAPSTPMIVEVAEDLAFARVVALSTVYADAVSDWTVRVLVGGLKPDHEYFYRFTAAEGAGSRVGRTLTAPAPGDTRAQRFAFVSCQNANAGAQNAYRRMIHDDEHASRDDRIGFVMHLGDFIYEIVWYPEDRATYYDRRIRDLVRYPHGEKVDDLHVPTDVNDYRAVYRAYLADPELQDARARWPFVPMWDNHEFSWQGWQSFERFDGKDHPAQTRKVAAMQAWWEYLPSRARRSSGQGYERFDPPVVHDTPITTFDSNGLSQEPNNLTALAALTGYRVIKWGKHIDLIITDQRSYRSEEPTSDPAANTFGDDAFPSMTPEEFMVVSDAGRSANGGAPPATLAWDGKSYPNVWKDRPPQTILGVTQRAWFLEQLKASRATWKIWGNTTGTLDQRADPQNLPAGLTRAWPGTGYASMGGGDHGTAYVERGEIYDFVAREKITGFAAIAGDRHSFWAGYAAKMLPPAKYEPVGLAFVTGSISAPGFAESLEHKFPKDHPLRPLFLADRTDGKKPDTAINLTMRGGVRAALEYSKSHDLAKTRAAANPDNAPNVTFLDWAGHGYAVVRASATAFETEFVCIERPVERSTAADGGPLRYRVLTHTPLWRAGQPPRMETRLLEGDAGLSMV